MNHKKRTLFVEESCLKETNSCLEVCRKLRSTMRIHLVDRVVEGGSREGAIKR